jgi:hypothetical protein
MVLLFIGLGRRLPSLHLDEIGLSAGRTLIASVAAGGAGYLTAERLAGLGQAGALLRAAPGVAGAVVFGVVFFVVAYVAKSDELHSLVRAVRAKVRR